MINEAGNQFSLTQNNNKCEWILTHPMWPGDHRVQSELLRLRLWDSSSCIYGDKQVLPQHTHSPPGVGTCATNFIVPRCGASSCGSASEWRCSGCAGCFTFPWADSQMGMFLLRCSVSDGSFQLLDYEVSHLPSSSSRRETLCRSPPTPASYDSLLIWSYDKVLFANQKEANIIGITCYLWSGFLLFTLKVISPNETHRDASSHLHLHQTMWTKLDLRSFLRS